MSDTIKLYLKKEGDLQEPIKIELPDGNNIMRRIGDYSNKPLDFEPCRDFIGCDLQIFYMEDGEETGGLKAVQTLIDVTFDEKLTDDYNQPIFKLVYEEKKVQVDMTKESESEKDKVVSVTPLSEKEVLEDNKDIPWIGGKEKEEGWEQPSEAEIKKNMYPEEKPEKEDKEPRLIEVGKMYPLVTQTGIVGAYCRIDFIEPSQLIGHKEVAMLILAKGQPMLQVVNLPVTVMDLNNPISFQIPGAPYAVIFNDIPLATKRDVNVIKSKMDIEKLNHSGGATGGKD